MNYINIEEMKKLKSDNSIAGIVPAIFSYLMFGLVSALFGFSVGLDTLGAIILVYSVLFGLWNYLRTTNPNYLVSFFYLVVFGLFLFVFDPYMLKSRGGQLDTQSAFLIILIFFFAFWLIFLFVSKKLKWRGREVMELAAIDVMEGEDSYTDRPRPVGKITGSKLDITGFARYLKRNLIFMSSEESNRVILVPVKMGKEFKVVYRSNINSIDNTRITIDFEGNVSVHISKKDYLDYRDDLSFDHLSESLGNLVIEFYEQYANREEVRIIDKINTVKVGYFS